MRFLTPGLFTVAFLITLSGPTASAQDQRGARREFVRWEYAELSFRTIPARPAGKDADGNDVPAREASVAIRWTTGTEDLTLNGWAEMAEKLKVEFKKDASAVSQRLAVMNALGTAGWELVESQSTTPGPATMALGRGNQPGNANPPANVRQVAPTGRTTGTMLFKRRV